MFKIRWYNRGLKADIETCNKLLINDSNSKGQLITTSNSNFKELNK